MIVAREGHAPLSTTPPERAALNAVVFMGVLERSKRSPFKSPSVFKSSQNNLQCFIDEYLRVETNLIHMTMNRDRVSFVINSCREALPGKSCKTG